MILMAQRQQGDYKRIYGVLGWRITIGDVSSQKDQGERVLGSVLWKGKKARWMEDLIRPSLLLYVHFLLFRF